MKSHDPTITRSELSDDLALSGVTPENWCVKPKVIESTGYSALPSPLRLMRPLRRAVAAGRTHTQTHRRRRPRYLLHSLSDAAKVISFAATFL